MYVDLLDAGWTQNDIDNCDINFLLELMEHGNDKKKKKDEMTAEELFNRM